MAGKVVGRHGTFAHCPGNGRTQKRRFCCFRRWHTEELKRYRTPDNGRAIRVPPRSSGPSWQTAGSPPTIQSPALKLPQPGFDRLLNRQLIRLDLTFQLLNLRRGLGHRGSRQLDPTLHPSVNRLDQQLHGPQNRFAFDRIQNSSRWQKNLN